MSFSLYFYSAIYARIITKTHMRNIVCRHISLLCYMAVCLASCGWHETRSTLKLAESLMSERPDSALNMLLEVNPNDLHTKRQRAKHALLLSMALDKNYIDVADDSLTQIAYNYYIKHGSGPKRGSSSLLKRPSTLQTIISSSACERNTGTS